MHNYPQNSIFLYHNLQLHKMIEMHSQYDNMHINIIFNALNCTNNYVYSSINYKLSVPMRALWKFSPSLPLIVISVLEAIQSSSVCADIARGRTLGLEEHFWRIDRTIYAVVENTQTSVKQN